MRGSIGEGPGSFVLVGGFQTGQEGAFDLKGVGQLVALGLKRRFSLGEPEVEPDQMFDVI